jgi:hypothetical protein
LLVAASITAQSNWSGSKVALSSPTRSKIIWFGY